MKKEFKLKKGEIYDAGNCRMNEYIFNEVCEVIEGGWLKYNDDYEVTIEIKKKRDRNK
jgi:hypothetical protein